MCFFSISLRSAGSSGRFMPQKSPLPMIPHLLIKI
jgi:hypothetical protein